MQRFFGSCRPVASEHCVCNREATVTILVHWTDGDRTYRYCQSCADTIETYMDGVEVLDKEHLFDPGDPEPVSILSRDRRRTIRNRHLLDQGRHPITGTLLADNGETCKTCGHLKEWRYAKTYWKCELNATHGANTDVRVSWPACTMWTP